MIGDKKRKGREAICARCENAVESMEHAYAQCETVQRLWTLILERWEVATKEKLDPSDLRVTMLGDRGAEDYAVSRDLWRLVHAATAWVIHISAKKAREGRNADAPPKKDTPVNMIQQVQKELQRLVTAAWITRGKGEAQLPWGSWRAERWVMRRGDKVGVQVLQRGYDRPEGWRVNVPVAAAAQPAPPHAGTADRCAACDEDGTEGDVRDAASVRWMQFTDGSWEPPEEGGNQIREAGAGVALFEKCAESAPGAFPMGQLVNAPTAFARADVTRNAQDTRCERSGHAKLKSVRASTVVIEPNEHEYIGAEAHTNNTGELTAMYHALSNALMRPAGEGREIIWSDSLYTINMTTGRWRPRCPRNREIVASTRGLWRRVQRQRDAEVELRHVRSHTRVSGNELADWLADVGREEGGPVSAVCAQAVGCGAGSLQNQTL